jgi:hypothetical protein
MKTRCPAVETIESRVNFGPLLLANDLFIIPGKAAR